MPQRRTDLDALRSFAMLLGIGLHASLSFFAFPWPVHDLYRSDLLPLFLAAVHGFRMPLFFLLSGYFTMLVYRRRGLRGLLEQRFTRILLPLVVAVATIMPLDTALKRVAHRTIRPEPAVAEILSGDEAAVRRRLVTTSAVQSKDAFYGRTPLAWATMHGDPAIVAAVLDAGADVNERDGSGNTPLHVVALFGRDAACRLLLERGADPLVRNIVGRLPAAILALPAELASEYAPLLGLNTLGVDAVLQGRARLRELLPTGPNAAGTLGGPLDRLTLARMRMASSESLRLRVGSWSLHLIETNVFDHLWFLWFLCWLVAVFALLAVTGLLPSGRERLWLVVASVPPQAVMGMSLAGFYGPDSSLGILPQPHVLAYYACFYFFGVATYAAEGFDTRLGRHWKFLLPAAVAVFVAGIVTMNDRLLAVVLQPAFAWTMSLGLIGLFHRCFGEPRPAMSWLADASYWMYLVHVPLVLAAQLVVRQWPLPAEVKFIVILATMTVLLLASYRWCVRYTAIGSFLNGPRTFPAAGQDRG
jgi:peptidoglycan/LPS O-acetylase OafA/YrhL